MFKYFKDRIKGDRADSNLISIVIVFPLIIGVFFGTIDLNAYFNNRSQIYKVAHSAARSVALVGGVGNAGQSTEIEAQYGQKAADICQTLPNDTMHPAVAKVKAGNRTIECNVMHGLINNAGLINTEINAVKCTPEVTKALTERASCEIKWRYKGVPGSAMSFIKLSTETTTAASVESEVASPKTTARR